MLLWYIGITAPREKGIRMMLYRFEVDYTVPGKMGNKNYVTAVAATDAAHARVEAGKIFEGLKEDYGYDKALVSKRSSGERAPFSLTIYCTMVYWYYPIIGKELYVWKAVCNR